MNGLVALTHEQGQDFAVLRVKSSVVLDPRARAEAIALGNRLFGVRTALLADDGRTWGPPDIVRWLAGIDPRRLPWRNFSA